LGSICSCTLGLANIDGISPVLSDMLKRVTSGSESWGTSCFKSLPGTESGATNFGGIDETQWLIHRWMVNWAHYFLWWSPARAKVATSTTPIKLLQVLQLQCISWTLNNTLFVNKSIWKQPIVVLAWETLVHLYLLFHRVGLHSGGSSLSGYFLLGMWSGCESICSLLEQLEDYPDLLWPPVRHFDECYPDSDPGCQQWHETRGYLD